MKNSDNQLTLNFKSNTMAHKVKANAFTYTVTPELAEQWLKRNKRNRPLTDAKVREYVDAIHADRWPQNGESIKFDINGDLLDGQHRLNAVIIAKKSVKMLVVEGLDPMVFDTIDIGKVRSGADILHIKGHKHAGRAAAAVKIVKRYEQVAAGESHDAARFTAEIRPTEICEAIAERIGIIKTIGEIGTANPKKIMPRALFDALYYLFWCKDKQMAKEFMIALRDGINIQDYPAGLNLRERLINSNMDSKHGFNQATIAAMVVKVWNAARASKPLQRATWNPEVESFPIIQ